MSTTTEEKLEEIEDAITEILFVVTDVTLGDLSGYIPLAEDEDTPQGALRLAINQMIEALRQAREQNEKTMAELQEKVDLITQQSLAIQELSTPILQVWDGILVMPIIGVVDSKRALDIMEKVLEAVTVKQAQSLILDITGVEIVDTSTADHLIKVIRAVELLGARCVLTGIRPQVAQTLVDIGVDLSVITTLSNLKEGLRACLRLKKDKLRSTSDDRETR